MTVSEQFVYLLVMLLSGVVIGAVIDCVRVLQQGISSSSYIRRFAIPFELIVWTLLGVGTYMLLFALKKGDFRVIDPIAQVLGLLLYQLFLQKPIRVIGRILWLVFLKPIWLLIITMIRIVQWNIELFVKIILVFICPISKLCNNYILLPLKKRFKIVYNKK